MDKDNNILIIIVFFIVIGFAVVGFPQKTDTTSSNLITDIGSVIDVGEEEHEIQNDLYDGYHDNTNKCGNNYYGFPDYMGTPKEGDTCNDVFYDKDLECLANPPINYDGTIDLSDQTSIPLITCCEDDGTCQWER